jgi:alpha-methylacyl-CoA racemase
VEQADALIEGFRPGAAERLGIGPAQCRERNPRLVSGRMTGWGQDGPWAEAGASVMPGLITRVASGLEACYCEKNQLS